MYSVCSFCNINTPTMAGGKLPCGITEHRVGRWSKVAPANHWKSVGERARRKVKGQKVTRE